MKNIIILIAIFTLQSIDCMAQSTRIVLVAKDQNGSVVAGQSTLFIPTQPPFATITAPIDVFTLEIGTKRGVKDINFNTSNNFLYNAGLPTINFNKALDKSSPTIEALMHLGGFFSILEFSMLKQNGGGQLFRYLVYEFKIAGIKSIKRLGMVDQISFEAKGMKVSYVPQNPQTGALLTPIIQEWNFIDNNSNYAGL